MTLNHGTVEGVTEGEGGDSDPTDHQGGLEAYATPPERFL